jgi:glucosamine kinase
MAMTLLGVDAGGSRTSAVAADEAGRILARAEEGPGNARPETVGTAADTISRACRDALQRARRPAPAAALVAGVSGAGRDDVRSALEHALRAAGFAQRVLVVTDADIALEAAFGESAGIVLIAGTGSIAWARCPDGTLARAGGLGSLVGDHGSAYDLGLRGLRSAALALEGLGPATVLGERLAVASAAGADGLSRWAASATVADVAALAPIVLDAARDKDAVARTLVRESAQVLAAHVARLAARFPAGPSVPVAFGGGMLAKRKDFRAKVITQLKRLVPAAAVQRVPVDGGVGAIRMAVRL